MHLDDHKFRPTRLKSPNQENNLSEYRRIQMVSATQQSGMSGRAEVESVLFVAKRMSRTDEQRYPIYALNKAEKTHKDSEYDGR